MIFKIIFLAVLIIHGGIHLLGFLKAFDLLKTDEIKKLISKPLGILWLFVTVLFFTTAILLIFKNNLWLISGFISIIFSQILIFSFGSEAKYGTLANIIILIVIVLSYGIYRFEKNYINDVKGLIEKNKIDNSDILTVKDIQHIPVIVQKYLKYCNVIGKPKVKNFRVVFKGQMRSRERGFFDFISEQYNFIDDPARLFFMKGEMYGFTVPGYHKYINATASMDIRLFGFFPLIKIEGEVMDKAETVTLFNDMCLFAPSTLIDNRIQWEVLNDTTVNAKFTNKGISISADLYFDKNGRLTNFISNDRTDVSDMKQYPFLTPINDYANINDVNVVCNGFAIWRYPDRDFIYGNFNLKEINYNLIHIK